MTKIFHRRPEATAEGKGNVWKGRYVCHAYDGRYVSSKGRGNAYGSMGWAKEGIECIADRLLRVTSRRAGGVKGGELRGGWKTQSGGGAVPTSRRLDAKK